MCQFTAFGKIQALPNKASYSDYLQNPSLNRNCCYRSYGLWFFGSKPTRCRFCFVFFSSNWTTSCIIAGQCDMLATILSRSEHAGFISESYSQSPLTSETINGEQLLGNYLFLSNDQKLYWNSSQLTCLFYFKYSRGALWEECENVSTPAWASHPPQKAPFLLPQLWVLTEPLLCLFKLKGTSLLTPSRGTNIFSPSRDLNSVGRVNYPGSNQKIRVLPTIGNSLMGRHQFFWQLQGQSNPPFHIPL